MSTEKIAKYGKLSQIDQAAESLVAPSPADVEKPTDATRMVELMAPATLIEGYILDVKIGDEIVPISIPPGGVEKGQKFSIPMPESKKAVGESDGPVGAWKDGLCDCFDYGLCHASCCISWFCNLIALGQVVTRLKLNWCGRTTDKKSDQKSAFSVLVAITCFYFVVKVALKTAINQITLQAQMNPYNHDPSADGTLVLLQLILSFVSLGYLIVLVIVGVNVRSAVRSKYSIPETSCQGGMEDCCCIFWCTPCSISQMLRHTGDYENKPAGCCTEHGHYVV